MLMKTLFENSFARIWYDGCSPILFVKIQEFPDQVSFCQFGKSMVSSVKKILSANSIVYALVDFSDCSSGYMSSGKYALAEFFQKQLKCGLSFIAVINPKREEIATEFIQAIQLVDDSIERRINYFACFEKALRNINTRRTMRLLS